MDPTFVDRRAAGRRLAEELLPLAGEHPVVVALPRGGVPVAYEVARELRAPLDVVVVRKLGVPFQPEVGMGAVAEGGVCVVDEAIVAGMGVTDKELARVRDHATRELERLAARFRRGRQAPVLRDRVVIVVDDGLATGGTARAAVEFVRARGARRVVVAVPVAAPDAVRRLETVADDVVALFAPETFRSVGQFYRNFAQVADDKVVALLIAASSAREAMLDDPEIDDEIGVRCGDVELRGRLTVPEGAFAVVVGALASEDGRNGARTRRVTAGLNAAGLATLALDLLADGEASRREHLHDVDLLTERLRAGLAWWRDQPAAAGRPVGLLGYGIAAGAVFAVAGDTDASIDAVIALAGRFDPDSSALGRVVAPTLLLVGADDPTVDAQADAADRLGGTHRLDLVEGAALVDDPEALDGVRATVAQWFVDHLGRSAARAPQRDGSRPG